MGVCYYLARDDNHSLYELWKVSEWRDAFAELSTGGVITPSDHDPARIADALRRHSTGWGYEGVLDGDYLERVAADIVRWADGWPFRFISEHDRRIDGNYPDSPFWLDFGKLNITGSRFFDVAF